MNHDIKRKESRCFCFYKHHTRIKIDDTNDLNGMLYFELTTKDKYGTENVYQLQMALTEITKNNGN